MSRELLQVFFPDVVAQEVLRQTASCQQPGEKACDEKGASENSGLPECRFLFGDPVNPTRPQEYHKRQRQAADGEEAWSLGAAGEYDKQSENCHDK